MKRRLLYCLAAIILLTGVSLLFSQSAMAASKAKWPANPAKWVKRNGKMQLDDSHLEEGYFWAAVQKKTGRRLKLRVVKGKDTLTYDLNGDGDYELFPLQLGDGKYEITLWENISGKKYSSAGKLTVTVKLKSKDSPFLYPNQYVNYEKTTQAVKEADSLCAGKKNKAAYQAVKDFMKSHFVYDYVKAITVQPGVLPDIEGSYQKHMGVCQDLSAIMVCMLRTQGIPAKLIIGYAGSNYHAWTMTKIDKKYVFYDPTAALNAITQNLEYSVERYY